MEYGVTLVVNASPVARSEEHLWHPLPLGNSTQSSAGVEINRRSILGYPPLWRAVNLISSSVAGLPFDIFKRQRGGGKKVDQRHPGQMLLEKKANRFISAYTFRRAMTANARRSRRAACPRERRGPGRITPTWRGAASRTTCTRT